MAAKLLNNKTGSGKKAIFIEKRGELRERLQKSIIIYDLFEQFIKFGFREDRFDPVYLSP